MQHLLQRSDLTPAQCHYNLRTASNSYERRQPLSFDNVSAIVAALAQAKDLGGPKTYALVDNTGTELDFSARPIHLVGGIEQVVVLYYLRASEISILSHLRSRRLGALPDPGFVALIYASKFNPQPILKTGWVHYTGPGANQRGTDTDIYNYEMSEIMQSYARSHTWWWPGFWDFRVKPVTGYLNHNPDEGNKSMVTMNPYASLMAVVAAAHGLGLDTSGDFFAGDPILLVNEDGEHVLATETPMGLWENWMVRMVRSIADKYAERMSQGGSCGSV